jgi:hypothetical protein
LSRQASDLSVQIQLVGEIPDTPKEKAGEQSPASVLAIHD